VLVLEQEGISVAFGVPGAAINPLYAALRKRGSIRHILARHVEGASHMADGYTRAKPGAITKGRKFIHVDIEPTQIGRVFGFWDCLRCTGGTSSPAQ